MPTDTSGLLLLDKPQGFTSHDAVAVARRALGTKCIGHSGTLDPMASGLLILLVGRAATRQQERFLKLPKIYRAELHLGTDTDSWDAQGTPIKTLPVPPMGLAQITAAAQQLTGQVCQQIPPFSAKKINGRKMYDLAREGQPVQDRFNTVQIDGWDGLAFDGKDKISFTLRCGCGTYVRSLGRMLAQKLGTTGHLTALRRLQIGPFGVERAVDARKLKTTPREEIVQWLQEPLG